MFAKPAVEKKSLLGYIIFAGLVMAFVGRPSTFLVISGVINGFVLPIILIVMFILSRKPEIIGEGFKCPKYLSVLNFVIMIFLTYAAILAVPRLMQLFG